MDRGAWQTTVHGVAMSQTWLSDWAYTHAHNHETSQCDISHGDGLILTIPCYSTKSFNCLFHWVLTKMPWVDIIPFFIRGTVTWARLKSWPRATQGISSKQCWDSQQDFLLLTAQHLFSRTHQANGLSSVPSGRWDTHQLVDVPSTP